MTRFWRIALLALQLNGVCAIGRVLMAQPVQNDHVLIGTLVAVNEISQETVLSVDVGTSVVELAAATKQCLKMAGVLSKALPQTVTISLYLSDADPASQCYFMEGLHAPVDK